MQRKTKVRPSLELLEDRCVPATVHISGSYLFISNPTVSGGKASIIVNEVAPGSFQVLDGAQASGPYLNPSSIFIKGSTANDSITFNVNNFTYNGSLTITEQNGNDSINVVGNGGAISGYISILMGSGSDSVSLNNASTGALTVGGTTTIVHALSGTDTVRFGNPSAVSRFLGNVNLTGVTTVRVGPSGSGGVSQADVFGGDFNTSVGQNSNQTIDFQQDPAANGAATITIAGNLQVQGGSGNVGVLTGAMTIGKNLVVNLATSQGSVTGRNDLSVSASGVTTVQGNLYYTGGGNNMLDLTGGVFHGNVNVTLDSGNDSIALDNAGGSASTLISGNLGVNKGNGSLNTTPFGRGIQATIRGSVIMTLGNGNSNIVFDNGGTVGGLIKLYFGYGNNQVSFLGAQTYNVDARFGNGDNMVTLNNANAVLEGDLIGGTGANIFHDLAGTLAPGFHLVNFTQV